MRVHLFPVNPRFTFWYIAPVFPITVFAMVFTVYTEFHALLYNVGVDKPFVQNSVDKIKMSGLKRFKDLSRLDRLFHTDVIKMEEWLVILIPHTWIRTPQLARIVCDHLHETVLHTNTVFHSLYNF